MKMNLIPKQFRRSHLVSKRGARLFAAISVLCFGMALAAGPAAAQGEGAVQELTGRIAPGEAHLYLLPDLRQGQRLYLRAQATSGNLDPMIGLTEADLDPEALESALEATLDQALADALDPLKAAEQFRDQYSLAWDDDSGGGLTAALELKVPADGDYRLFVMGALSSRGGHTFGDYRLLLGLDNPAVLDGSATPTGDVIAIPDVEATPPGIGVQETSGTLTADKTSTLVSLGDFQAGDTLYAFVEATSGDLAPSLVLESFAAKPIRSANLDGSTSQASLQYTFLVEARNYRLKISACCPESETTAGDYRLLVGANCPEVLTGEAQPDGRAVIREPIQVKIGTKVEQIVDLDQKSEFFTAVVSLRMEWTDPALAFNPEECQCDVKTYSGDAIDQFFVDRTWPAFSIQNQQGNRWTQNRELVVFANGRAVYFERFTTNFQVDFDFRQFPFDTQRFEVRVDSLYPEEYVRFAALEGFAEISPEYGEDEFILTDFDTSVSTVKGSSGADSSRFVFSYEAPRHLSYYIFQVFVPILLIILVSWFTFFLRDYRLRIEVASGNLLLFIAFSWSLADNYPRLGYLTFLDAVMAILFVVNALVVMYNVLLRRMEKRGQGEQAERIDTVLDWAYPLAYLACFGVVVLIFF